MQEYDWRGIAHLVPYAALKEKYKRFPESYINTIIASYLVANRAPLFDLKSAPLRSTVPPLQYSSHKHTT